MSASLVAPSMLPTTTVAVVIGPAFTLTIPTSIPIIIVLEVPPVVHLVAESTLDVLPVKAPINVLSLTTVSTVVIPNPITESPLELTQISSSLMEHIQRILSHHRG